MAEIVKAVIYGIIEGITEWLPISSTGHMILAEEFLKFQLSESFLTMFRVVIQLGAIMAVVVLFWGKLWPFKAAAPDQPPLTDKEGKPLSPVMAWLATHLRWPVVFLWFKILVATLPAAVLGLLLDDWMDAHLYNHITVAVTLILYGIAFIVIEKTPRPVRQTKLSRLTYKDALVMGGFQVLSLIPGTSRSGSTILGGMLFGLSRPLAAQFSFFMAIPVMFGASLLKVVKFLVQGNALTGLEVMVLLVGTIVAFFVSLLCIRFLMNYVRSHSFAFFGWYRIVLGVVVLTWWVVSSLISQGAI